MRNMTLVIFSLLVVACEPMDEAPDSAVPVDSAPVVDGGGVVDAEPCTTITWDADDLSPPFATLSASRDALGQPLPIVVNTEGGLGVGDDAVIGMDEGLTIEFDQSVRLYEYRARGDGSHQVQLILAQPPDQALLIESDRDGQVGVGRDVARAEIRGVSDSVVLEQMMYMVCDQTGSR
jgi:hypothetical protein